MAQRKKTSPHAPKDPTQEEKDELARAMIDFRREHAEEIGHKFGEAGHRSSELDQEGNERIERP